MTTLIINCGFATLVRALQRKRQLPPPVSFGCDCAHVIQNLHQNRKREIKQDRKKRQSCSVKLGIDPKQSKLNLRVKKSVDPERKKRYNAAVTKFIVCDERSFKLSVGAEFQKLCKKLTDSSYVPSRPTTISRKVRGPVLSNTKY